MWTSLMPSLPARRSRLAIFPQGPLGPLVGVSGPLLCVSWAFGSGSRVSGSGRHGDINAPGRISLSDVPSLRGWQWTSLPALPETVKAS